MSQFIDIDDIEGRCGVCYQIWDGVKQMGQCSRCCHWFHLLCIRIEEVTFERLPAYYCRDCLTLGRHFTYKRLSADEQSYQSLDIGHPIDDVIIQFYSMWSIDTLPKDQQGRFYIFPVFFYTKLTDSELRTSKTDKNSAYQSVQRWTKDVNLFEKDFSFIFVNVARSHWILIVVCYPLLDKPEVSRHEGRKYYSKRPCLLILDPLNKGEHVRKSITDNIYIYLTCEFHSKYTDRIKIFGNHNFPTIAAVVPEQRPSTNDCGAFVLKYLSCMLKNQLTKWDRPIDCQNWFTTEEGSQMRGEVKSLLEMYETTPVRITRVMSTRKAVGRKRTKNQPTSEKKRREGTKKAKKETDEQFKKETKIENKKEKTRLGLNDAEERRTDLEENFRTEEKAEAKKMDAERQTNLNQHFALI